VIRPDPTHAGQIWRRNKLAGGESRKNHHSNHTFRSWGTTEILQFLFLPSVIPPSDKSVRIGVFPENGQRGLTLVVITIPCKQIMTTADHARKPIPWWSPQIEQEEFSLVAEVLRSNFVNDGPVIERFENEIARRLGAAHALAVASGTVALYLSLKALGIGQGDEVIVPDVTFIATANAVTIAGAKVVLADVDSRTLTRTPRAAETDLRHLPRGIGGRSAGCPDGGEHRRRRMPAVDGRAGGAAGRVAELLRRPDGRLVSQQHTLVIARHLAGVGFSIDGRRRALRVPQHARVLPILILKS
jgi:hypothetical protein